MKMTRASIILATYCPNQERYDFCERSFSEIHQTGLPRKEYELIVVDNGGMHRDLVEALDADVVVTNSRNLGQAAAFNQGISIAKSGCLALMDDDLSYRQGWLKYGWKLLRQFPNHVISLRELDRQRYICGETKDGHKLARKVGGVWIIRKGVYDSVGRFGVGYYSYGGLYTRNLRRKGYTFLVSKEPYIIHIGHGKSIIGKKQDGKWKHRLMAEWERITGTGAK